MTDSPSVAGLQARPTVARIDSPNSFKINNFDLIRLFAAIQVLVFHSFHRFGIETPGLLIPFSLFPGVPIFFVISGFLISGAWERNRDLFAYSVNRALRILPALWVCVAITACVAAALGYPIASGAGLVWLFAQFCGFIYTPAFLSSFGVGSYNGSLWTIPVELQFYVMLPIVYWLAFRTRSPNWVLLATFLTFLALGAAIATAFPDMATKSEHAATKLLRYSFIPRFYLFLLGVLLRRAGAHASPWIRGKGGYWLAGYLILAFSLPRIGVLYMLGEMMMGVTVIALAYTLPTLAERMLRGTDLSYGVYLYHGLIINILFEIGWRGMMAPTPFVLLASLAAAAFSWFLIERPAIRSKTWLSRLHRSDTPDPDPGGGGIAATA